MSKNKGNKNKGKDKGNFRSDFLKHPGPLAKPLNNHSFKRELKSMTKLEFGPQQRQLQSEKRISNLQQQRIGDWFNQYQQQLGRISQASNQGYNQAIAGSQADTSAANAYADKLRAQTGQQSAASAALRGASVDPGVAQTDAQAAISRDKSNTNFTGLLRTQGANEKSYYKDKKRIGKGEEISQLLAEAGRGRQVNQDLHDLNQQKRDFADKFLHDTRSQQQDFYLGLLQAKLGQKQAKLSAQTSRANAQTSANASIANSKRSAHQSNINSKRSAHTSRANDKRGGSSSSSSSNKHDRKVAIQQMVNRLAAAYKHGHFVDSKGHKLSPAEVRAAVQGHSTTYTKKEFHKALHKFKKKHKKPYRPPTPF